MRREGEGKDIGPKGGANYKLDVPGFNHQLQ
jgi:hypothetical protein